MSVGIYLKETRGGWLKIYARRELKPEQEAKVLDQIEALVDEFLEVYGFEFRKPLAKKLEGVISE